MGKTGSGKTFLAKSILRLYRYVIVYDVKGQMRAKDWPEFLFVRKFEDLEKAANSRRPISRDLEYPKIVFQPGINEIPDADNLEPAEKLCRFVYDRKNTVFYVDEAYSITSGRKIPFWYKAILTRGRERGLTLITACQRPKEIPMFILSESENYIVFSLQLPQDREVIEKIKGIPAGDIERLDKFQFLIANEIEYSARPKKLKV